MYMHTYNTARYNISRQKTTVSCTVSFSCKNRSGLQGKWILVSIGDYTVRNLKPLAQRNTVVLQLSLLFFCFALKAALKWRKLHDRRATAAGEESTVTIQGGPPPKSKPLQNEKNRIKSYRSLRMRYDLFVNLKYESSTMILFVDITYSMRDLLSDGLTRKRVICVRNGK